MALVVPNIQGIIHGTNGFDCQGFPDLTDISALQATDGGTGVIAGGPITAQSSPNMTVQSPAYTVLVNGTVYTVAANTSISVATAGASDRRDIIIFTVGSGVLAVAGTPCGTPGWTRNSSGLAPVKPSIPASSVLLGEVTVNSSTSSIPAINIVDKTAPASATPGTLLNRVQPAAHATYTTTVATVTAIDGTNVTFSFVAPPSGAVILTAQFVVQTTTPAGFATFNWLNHGLSTVFGNASSLTIRQDLAAMGVTQTYTTLVTGLTPGTTYAVDLGWASTSGDTLSIFPNVAATTAVGTAAAGPILLTAIAA